MSAMPITFHEQILQQFWRYTPTAFAGQDELLEQAARTGDRPPVFRRNTVTHNIVTHPRLTDAQRHEVVSAIPHARRHRWFRSMKSSQALAQSVFGNLKVLQKLSVLDNIQSDIAAYPFAGVQHACLERSIDFLGEDPRRCTSVDVWLAGRRNVAVECKFAESNIGTCSRPRLDPLEFDFCNGSYSIQNGRTTHCSLTAAGIRYWEYLPQLMTWDCARDWTVCPLSRTYQIMRNMIAAVGKRDGSVDLASGAMVLLVDARNPAFQTEGLGRTAIDSVRAALRVPELLQLVTWQAVTAALRNDKVLAPLAESLEQKYGF